MWPPLSGSIQIPLEQRGHLWAPAALDWSGWRPQWHSRNEPFGRHLPEPTETPAAEQTWGAGAKRERVPKQWLHRQEHAPEQALPGRAPPSAETQQTARVRKRGAGERPGCGGAPHSRPRCSPGLWCSPQDLKTVLPLPQAPGEFLHPVVYACTAVTLLCLLASTVTYLVHQR